MERSDNQLKILKIRQIRARIYCIVYIYIINYYNIINYNNFITKNVPLQNLRPVASGIHIQCPCGVIRLHPVYVKQGEQNHPWVFFVQQYGSV